MTMRSSHVCWVLVSSTGLLLVLAIAYLGGVSLLSAPRKPPAPAAVVVVDANGNTVGTVAGMDEFLVLPVVIVNTSAGEVALHVFSDHLSAGTEPYDLFFLLPGCEGTPYILAGGLDIEHSVLRRATIFAPDQNTSLLVGPGRLDPAADVEVHRVVCDVAAELLPYQADHHGAVGHIVHRPRDRHERRGEIEPADRALDQARRTPTGPGHRVYVAGTTREMAVIQSRREALAGICSPYSYSDRDFVQAVAVGNIYQQYPPPYSLR